MSLRDYIDHKPILETQNLILRGLCKDDIPALREWMGNPSLYQFWGQKAEKSDLNPELLFAKAEKPTADFHWGIIHKTDNKAIGEFFVYLIKDKRMAKVAYRFSDQYQGRGYATEALKAVVEFCFTKTELRRLWSDVDVRNTASCRVLEKCGFTREGHIRQGKMVAVYCDYYIYGILREDFSAEE